PDQSEKLLAMLAEQGRIQRSPGVKGSAKASGYWTEAYIRHCKEQALIRAQELLEKSYPRLAIEQAIVFRATSSLGPSEFIHWILQQLADENKIKLNGS